MNGYVIYGVIKSPWHFDKQTYLANKISDENRSSPGMKQLGNAPSTAENVKGATLPVMYG